MGEDFFIFFFLLFFFLEKNLSFSFLRHSARPDEAVSWGKIRLDAKPVKVCDEEERREDIHADRKTGKKKENNAIFKTEKIADWLLPSFLNPDRCTAKHLSCSRF